MGKSQEVRSPAGFLWPFDAYYGWAIAGTALVVSFASSHGRVGTNNRRAEPVTTAWTP